jgi:hypothetical protein
MEEAPEKGKESSHAAYAKGMNELICSFARLEGIFGSVGIFPLIINLIMAFWL